jgi:pimeloyl-ACP methyl ester carboxylesterase
MLSLTLLIVTLAVVAAVATRFATARIAALHPPTGRFVAVDGGRLHVLELGHDAEPGRAELQTDMEPFWPVVLVHGASGNLGDMRLALGDRLAQTRRVVLVDRPGHGWSDRPAGREDASPGRQAALIAEALDRLGLTRFVLVGHSLGGAVVTAFALAYPERVAGLVLLAAVTHPWPGGIAWYYSLGAMPFAGGVFARLAALPVGELLLEQGARGVFWPQAMPPDYLRAAGIRLMLRPHEFVANAQDVAILKRFVTAQAPHYGRIAAPTVVLTGDADATVSPDMHSRAIAAALPDARLVILPGIGHMPHHVATETVIEAIDSVSLRKRARSAQLSPGWR